MQAACIPLCLQARARMHLYPIITIVIYKIVGSFKLTKSYSGRRIIYNFMGMDQIESFEKIEGVTAI
jgi:hypothetical protein